MTSATTIPLAAAVIAWRFGGDGRVAGVRILERGQDAIPSQDSDGANRRDWRKASHEKRLAWLHEIYNCMLIWGYHQESAAEAFGAVEGFCAPTPRTTMHTKKIAA